MIYWRLHSSVASAFCYLLQDWASYWSVPCCSANKPFTFSSCPRPHPVPLSAVWYWVAHAEGGEGCAVETAPRDGWIKSQGNFPPGVLEMECTLKFVLWGMFAGNVKLAGDESPSPNVHLQTAQNVLSWHRWGGLPACLLSRRPLFTGEMGSHPKLCSPFGSARK